MATVFNPKFAAIEGAATPIDWLSTPSSSATRPHNATAAVAPVINSCLTRCTGV